MILQTLQDYEKLKKWLSEQAEVSFDIETNGDDSDKHVPVGLGFSYGHTGFYMALYDYDATTDSLIPTIFKPYETEIIAILAARKLFAWNGGFEAAFYPAMRYSLYIDGMLLRHTVDENRFDYGLKTNAAQEFGEAAISSYTAIQAYLKSIKAEHWQYYKAPRELVGRYCIDDCKLTQGLIVRDWAKLQREGLQDLFFTEVMELYKHVTMDMEQSGVRLDIPLALQTQTELQADIKSLEAKIQAEIEPHKGLWRQWLLDKDYPPARSGPFAQAYIALNKICLPQTKAGSYSLAAAALDALPEGHHKAVLKQEAYMRPDEVQAVQQAMYEADGKPDFNFASPHHLKKLFFDTLQEAPLSKTPTGQPQVDDDFLAAMATKYAWAADLQLLRSLRKLDGTYVTRLIDKSIDGVFYPRWNQIGTVTGRYSGDLQQLPRKHDEDSKEHPLLIKHTNKIRDLFIAFEGCVLIDADYESLEPHVFAHISSDPALIEIFQKGWDFYSTVGIKTEKLEGYSPDKKAPNYLGKLNKAKRQGVKPYALGIGYGEEEYKLALELGIPQADAALLIKGYWDGFSDLKKKSDAGKEHIIKHGYIATETDRRRRLHEASKIAQTYGTGILNSLELWKQFHSMPKQYEAMKKRRSKLKRALNAAINFPTQSLAASIVNRSMIALAKAYKAAEIPATIIATIHDEVLVSCQIGYEIEAAAIMQECLEQIYKLSVPLKAEPCIGTRYGDIK